MRPQRRGPFALEVREQPLVVLGHALERPARLELDHEQPQLARERLVRAQDPGAAGGSDERMVDGVVGLEAA